MPALHLFHRRTLLGGDDIQPALVVTSTGRAAQLLFLVTPILHNLILYAHEENLSLWKWMWMKRYDADNCPTSYYPSLVTIWIGATLIYGISVLCLEIQILKCASCGAPTEQEPRSSQVRKLLEFKLQPCSLCLLAIWFVGLIAMCVAAPRYYRCHNNHNPDDGERSQPSILFRWWWLAAAVLLLAQVVEVTVSGMFVWQLFRQAPPPVVLTQATENDEEARAWEDDDLTIATLRYNHELTEEMWAERCANFCECLSTVSCHVFGGRNLVNNNNTATMFGDVARALADFLETHNVLDVVPSDIMAGLVILQRLQRQRIYAARQELELREPLANPTTTATTATMPVASTLVQVDSDIVEDGNCVRKRTKSTHNIRKRGSSHRLSDQNNSGSVTVDDENGVVRRAGLISRSESDEGRLLLPEASMARNVSERLHPALYLVDQNGSYEEAERALLDRLNAEEMDLLAEVARYAKYALAIYTWVLYLYVNPVTGPARLIWQQNRNCSCCNRNGLFGRRRQTSSPTAVSSLNLMSFSSDDAQQGWVAGDTLCQVHKNAIMLTAGLEEADLVYVQLKSSFEDNPYCILLDHSWRSVVVSIRGTFSLEDCVTDVLIEPESLEQLGEEFGFDGKEQYCHGGVLACVRNVYRDLERHRILDDLLLGEDAQYSEYTLRLVGHSLGAAAGTLLSYMLRPRFPTLRCVNYSPPGCTFTWNLATQCSGWCSSCVLDCDLVPRLSFDSMERLRNEILELIGRIKVPKVEVARRFLHSSSLWAFRLCNDQDLEDKEQLAECINDILHDPDQVPDCEYQRQLARFKAIQDERRRHRGHARSVKLYPPGRMLHLAKTRESRSCAAGLANCLTCCTTNIGSHYVPVWIDNDDLSEIVVSPTMGTDHFPNRITDILEEVAEDFGLTDRDLCS